VKLGLIVNPIAGMGGSVGLHGTDGDTYVRAEKLGAKPISNKRAARAIRKLSSHRQDFRLWVGAGDMGERVARKAGFSPAVINVTSGRTGPEDTRTVAATMQDREIDLILFAGGDGTAREIVAQVGTKVPILGVPTGVKMHSAVFATSPEAAGELATRFVVSPSHVPTHEREVMDIDPEGNELARLLVASVPFAPSFLQSGKSNSPVGADSAIARLCAGLADGLKEDHIYVVGPGTTTNRIMEHLGISAPATAVNVLIGRTLLASDVSESQILDLLREYRGQASIILGVIGGQGFLLGRGNQQISSEVVAHVGEENVMVLASEEKLARLDPPVLWVDTGIEEAAPIMTGYRRVHTGPGKSVVMRVQA
jgi:predicted polyphosphate/ATP-dependent NAD kinase